MTHKKMLRISEISEIANCSVRTVRRWIADGTLPSVKIGGLRLVRKEDLDKLFQALSPHRFDVSENSDQTTDSAAAELPAEGYSNE